MSKPTDSFAHSDTMYKSYGAYSAFQAIVTALTLFVLPSNEFTFATLLTILLIGYFSWASWVFFSKKPYAQKVSRGTAAIIAVLGILQVMSGNFMILGSIVGCIIFLSFGVKTNDAEQKKTGSVIYSGNEFSKDSLRNWALLLLFIGIIVTAVYFILPRL